MKKSISLVFASVLTLAIAGCGNNSNNAGGNSAGSAGNKVAEAAAPADTTAKVTKIIVGTGTGFPQVCFIDENGKLTGFDVELLKEIDNKLPEYEFDFQTMDFSNLLLSLETKKSIWLPMLWRRIRSGSRSTLLTKKLMPTGETALLWLRTTTRSRHWTI